MIDVVTKALERFSRMIETMPHQRVKRRCEIAILRTERELDILKHIEILEQRTYEVSRFVDEYRFTHQLG